MKNFYGETKNIFHHFKGLSMKQINHLLLETESPTVSKVFMPVKY